MEKSYEKVPEIAFRIRTASYCCPFYNIVIHALRRRVVSANGYGIFSGSANADGKHSSRPDRAGRIVVSALSCSDSNGVITGSGFTGFAYNTITCKDIRIRWKLVHKSNGSIIDIGETKHHLYVIRGSVTKPYHTLAEFGCSAARGLSSQSAIIDAIWEKIRLLRVVREDGGDAFKYWGPFSRTYNVADAMSLIQYRDGRCPAWADLVNQLFLIQGVASESISVKPKEYSGYNDQNEYVEISSGEYTLPSNDRVPVYIGQTSTDYQGGTELINPFTLHVINRINNNYYDASCGSLPCSTKTEFVQKNLRLVYYDPGVKTISGAKLSEECFYWGDEEDE